MARRTVTSGFDGPTCTVEMPDAGWSYTTTGVDSQYVLRRDGADVGLVHLEPTVQHRSVAMAAIVAGLNHPSFDGGWSGPAAAFVDDIRTGIWPADRRKYPEAWRARSELVAKPTHVIAGAGGRAALCGVKRPLPVVLARYAAVHVESYGCELCPPCARALAELEEATA